MRLIWKWIICFGALVITAYGFPQNVAVSGGIGTIAVAATILWLANLLIRPLLQLISLPITLISFGLFIFIVNAWMVCLTDTILPGMSISSFWLCLFAALLISVFNTILLNKKRYN